jgi:signal transduction histidine kinase
MKIETNLSRKIAVSFGIALVISIVLGVLSYRNAVLFTDSAETVARTHRAISLLQATVAHTVSAESEARGYVITGEEHFLRLYETALRDVERNLDQLRALVRNPEIQARLLELERLAGERLARLKLTVEIRRLQGFEAVREASGPGKELMDALRKVAADIEARQRELLMDRAQEAATLSRRTIVTVIVSGILAVVVAAASVIILTADVAQRERMEKEALDVSEREQRRIGQDLHDGVCQQLTGISLLSRSLQSRLDGQAAADAGQVTRLINDCIEQTRRVTRGLHPVPDEPAGLQLALNELARSVSATTGVACHFECPAPVPVPDQNAATNLYRIAQEAVQNALRHAEAKRIAVTLQADEDSVTLSVTDDGRGLPAHRSGRGLGLEIMSYRAHTLGAEIQIGPNAGGGTVMTCTMPRASFS